MQKFYVVPSCEVGADIEKEVVICIWAITLKKGHDNSCWLSIHGDKVRGASSNQIRISKAIYDFLKSEMKAEDLTYLDKPKRKVKSGKHNTVRRHGHPRRSNKDTEQFESKQPKFGLSGSGKDGATGPTTKIKARKKARP